jgi:hypothetical protein
VDRVEQDQQGQDADDGADEVCGADAIRVHRLR